MTPSARLRLAKVLAMASSSHEGEAVAAVRLARQIMEQEGLSFADLARVAAEGNDPTPSVAVASAAHARNLQQLDTQLQDLRRRLRLLQDAASHQQVELSAARNTISQLEFQLGRSRAEVDRWRNLARDTADQLWDIGQQIAKDQTRAPVSVGTQGPRAGDRRPRPMPFAANLRDRRFVRNSLIDAQESGGSDSPTPSHSRGS